MTIPLIVSFYTPDWSYLDHAARLKEECNKLNLENYIVEIPSLNNYPKNCNIKPKFILDCLLEFQRSVLWVDVDNSIIKIPQEMVDNENYDIIGVSKKNHELIYVNCLCFNFTEKSKIFLKNWKDAADKFIDDGAFQQVKKQMSDIKILQLDETHNQTQYKTSQPVTPEACFINRLSSSDLKMQYKHRVEKK